MRIENRRTMDRSVCEILHSSSAFFETMIKGNKMGIADPRIERKGLQSMGNSKGPGRGVIFDRALSEANALAAGTV